MMRRNRFFGLTLAALCAAGLAAGAAGTANAQDAPAVLTGTLKTIADRGTLLLGYRQASAPFSFVNQENQPLGYSVDICHEIAVDTAKALGVDLLDDDAPANAKGLKIVYVPVASEERLSKLVSGDIDLECGSTTSNAERQKTVAFSPIIFLAGTKLMVPRESAIRSYKELGDKTVVVTAGTTNETVITTLLQRLAMARATADAGPGKLVKTPDLGKSYDLLAAGQADAFVSDDILLDGFLATKPDGHKFKVVGDYLSYEPYGIGYRRDDPDFAKVVDAAFTRMATDGILSKLYARWFTERLPNGENLDLPISPQLTEMFRILGQPD